MNKVKDISGGTLKAWHLMVGVVLMPLMIQAASVAWTNSVGSAWETGANWSAGAAPSNSAVFITNNLSKTVTISGSTSSDFLTQSGLSVEAPVGYTNTLLLSGNVSPLVIGSGGFNIGLTSGRGVGSFVINDGWLVTTGTIAYVGTFGRGLMTVQNGYWYGYQWHVGENSGSYGNINLSGGTSVVSYTTAITIANVAGSTGVVDMTGGLLVTTNGTSAVGNSGVGTINVSGGRWWAKSINVGVNSGSQGTLNLSGGIIDTTIYGYACYIGSLAGSTGTVLITGGMLNTTNVGTQNFYIGKDGVGSIIVSNGTWLADKVALGANSPTNLVTSKGTLAIAGGEVRTLVTKTATAGYVAGASNNTILVTGGLLEADSLLCPNGGGNVISNAGGVFQFNTISPLITTNGGPVVLNGGTLSFHNVATVNVTGTQAGTQLTNMTFTTGGQNAFRLNNATNATTGQSYSFASNLGAANYTRLELVNATNCYRGGSVTLGTGGSILFSNTTARLEGSFTNNSGASGYMAVVNSSVTITGACTLAENSTINWTSNAVGRAVALTVGGTLTLPTNATFTLSSPIGRNDTLTLFTATSGSSSIVGSPANWTLYPTSHRLEVVNNTLVLRPRAAGFVFQVQ